MTSDLGLVWSGLDVVDSDLVLVWSGLSDYCQYLLHVWYKWSIKLCDQTII